MVLLMAAFAVGCEQNERSVKQLNAYFDLDSLLDEQAAILYDRGAEVIKEVVMDGETEKRSFIPDTSEWKSELAIIRDFNINKPYFVGSFELVKEEGVLRHEATSENVDVTQFELFYEEDDLVRIESFLDEEKYIYTNKRKLILTFDKGLLSTYQIDGYQKMILQDEVDYNISGSISVK